MINKPSKMDIWIYGLIGYWSDVLLPDLTIIMGSSKQVDSHMWCDEVVKDKIYKIMYHPINIKEWNLPLAINGVLHEIGHIKFGWDGLNKGDIRDIVDEAVAERFSLDMMHEYYPECLDVVIEHTKEKMKDKNWRGKWKTHFLAYKQLEEYQ